MSCNEKIVKVVTIPVDLGEGPHWDETKQKLYFVDLYASQIHSYDPVTEQHNFATVGSKPVTFIVPVANHPGKFLISYGGDLNIVTWDGKSETVSDRRTYITIEEDPKRRMNDGKVSPSGVLFAGSMGEKIPPHMTVPPDMGNLFVVDTKQKPLVKKLVANIGISNGLAWNRDETILYWSETLDKKVFAFDYDRCNLTLTNQKTIIDFDKCGLLGKPDGMTIDMDGNLWLACVEGGYKVYKINPCDGHILDEISFGNVSDITSVAFGGPNCEELYVTSIRKDGQNNSGCVFKVSNLGVRGYPGVSVQLR